MGAKVGLAGWHKPGSQPERRGTARKAPPQPARAVGECAGAWLRGAPFISSISQG